MQKRTQLLPMFDLTSVVTTQVCLSNQIENKIIVLDFITGIGLIITKLTKLIKLIN